MSYQAINTTVGLTKISQSIATGIPINLTQMALGDGGGADVTPSESQVALVHEVHRAAINSIRQDASNPTWHYVELVVPATTGGWTIREFGIFDADGDLFAVGNFPATYKTVPGDGASNDLVVRALLIVADVDVITLVLDPSVVVASRQWVLTNITPALLLPGGTTHQVLRKKTNADGDTEWADPSSASILVSAVEEPEVLLAAGQQTVNLTLTNTTGLAVYIEGVRIFRGAGVQNWDQGASSTQVILGRSYPAGSRFRAVQNETAANIPDPLTASDNLSDVQSVATARANLSVYSKAESDQLQPAGNIAYTARSSPPPGWLAANGAAVSRAVYATLFDAIGIVHGAGDGSTTFNLPDLRGEFIRGLDSGRGVDVGRALGSWQADMFKSHTHDMGSEFGGAGNFNTPIDSAGVDETQSGNPTQATGGSETRPRNVALLAIIKF